MHKDSKTLHSPTLCLQDERDLEESCKTYCEFTEICHGMLLINLSSDIQLNKWNAD